MMVIGLPVIALPRLMILFGFGGLSLAIGCPFLLVGLLAVGENDRFRNSAACRVLSAGAQSLHDPFGHGQQHVGSLLLWWKKGGARAVLEDAARYILPWR